MEQSSQAPKKGLNFPVRHAEQGGQSVNVDLAFVPARHHDTSQLPAVSGSSGRLIVSPTPKPPTLACFPGQVFAEPERDYSEAMQAFVAASPAMASSCSPRNAPAPEQAGHAARKRAVSQAADRLRIERRQMRHKRQAEDRLWRALREQRRIGRSEQQQPALSPEVWRALREQRRQQLNQRRQQDALWRAARSQLRADLEPARPAREWIAVLIVTDNCTRQSYGLPVFRAGAHVTAEQIVEALRKLLPSELQFLISDRGTHFRAHAFAQLSTDACFVHVLTARHRPQSNGIAERFVRTLKEWLATQHWTSAEQLEELLAGFQDDYNNRPHQGLPIPGLSPNEFANRLWLL